MAHSNERFSPSTLVRFYKSPFQSYIEKYLKEVDPHFAKPDPEDPFMSLISKKGYKHEENILSFLSREYKNFIDIGDGDRDELIKSTNNALQLGTEVIFQGALTNENFYGRSDFLVKTHGYSKYGDFTYEIWDAKLAKTVRAEHIIQLCCYAEMICDELECDIPKGVIFTGKDKKEEFDLSNFYAFYESLRDVYFEFERSSIKEPPDPSNFSNWGEFSEHAKEIFKQQDHLIQIADIKASQIKKLNDHGIYTVSDLLAEDVIKPNSIDEEKFERMQLQARMQVASEKSNALSYQVLSNRDSHLGLASLPPKSTADIYFDLESNPINKNFVLHYLWGIAHEDDAEGFDCWWCHSEKEMKEVFNEFVEWIYKRWEKTPSMHIYHYGQFEVSTLRDLMGKFGCNETKVDNLLRNNVFVDLHRVIKHGLCIGAEGYGLKKIEPLFRNKRIDEVQSGQDSTVQYEAWIESEEGQDHKSSEILREIFDYNKEDCKSMIDLCDWLRKLQDEKQIHYFNAYPEDRTKESEDIELIINDLLSSIDDSKELPHANLLAQLCLYHKRENKPVWWRLFDRLSNTDEELMEDIDCLGNLIATGNIIQITTKSNGYEYKFDPNQDSKLKLEDKVKIKQDPTINVTIHDLNLDEGLCILKTTAKELPSIISLIPFTIVNSPHMEESIRKCATNYIKTSYLKPCIKNYLDRSRPNLLINGDEDLSLWGKDLLGSAIKLTTNLDGGCLCIQGPPGTGKTYIGSKVIAELVNKGFTVGITSNSHKAIDNLLQWTVKNLDEQNITGRICRINKLHDEFYDSSERLDRVPSSGNVDTNSGYKIFGGTAWAFSHPNFVDQLDYLFIDEAGQVPLANLVAISQSCKNIILMGDQMQLAQPQMGSHPDGTGLSSLEYLLKDKATIPKNIGLFLSETFRLHPNICTFISKQIYDDRLFSNKITKDRYIKNIPSDLNIPNSGMHYIRLDHEGNEQASSEEVHAIKELINKIQSCQLYDRGTLREIAPSDILIVSPFNHQIRNLQAVLGKDYQIGTVDKFQGRESPIVIVSMASSDIESSPRGTSFLFEKNRLNVAITRAQSLAVIVGSKNLENTSTKKINEIIDTSFYLNILKHSMLT